MNRRKFLHAFSHLSAAGLVIPFWQSRDGEHLLDRLTAVRNRSAAELATDESFWEAVRLAYSVSEQAINLNNGGVSPQPRMVQDAVVARYRLANELPSYNLWRKINKHREPLRERLAASADCSPEELVINRNATEGLETVIFGLELQAGDEIVLSKYDYPSMISAWKQRALRDGIKLVWVDLEVPMSDEAAIAERYLAAVTSRTRLVHLTHLINWTGQLVPVARIGEALQGRGIDVMVDGAHSYAQIDLQISELYCDYFATSLHKWLCAPFGTGFLYVRKEKITDLYPLFAATDPQSDDIRKFEHLGTRDLGIEMGASEALDFHEMIGIERKAARLRHLKEYWMEQANDIPGLSFGTDARLSAGMALCHFPDRYEPGELYTILWRDHRILTSPVNHERARGVRISPHIYTRKAELDRLLDVLRQL